VCGLKVKPVWGKNPPYMAGENMRYMFDTNTLNEIIKQPIDTGNFGKKDKYFITPVQYSEILQTKNVLVRKKLLGGFEVIKGIIPIEEVHIHSAPWGHYPWGHGPWGGGDGKYYGQILRKLSGCSGNKSSRGDGFDALIIETCKMNRMTLITNDRSVQKICVDIGVDWLTLEVFLTG
jgi:predicted nucleic acid-binding protein